MHLAPRTCSVFASFSQLAMRLLLAILVSSAAALAPTTASAATLRTFSTTYAQSLHGDIAAIGNANTTCNPAWTPAGSCDVNSQTVNNSTRGYGAVNDTDGDPSTTNSSSSTVTIPSGSTIVDARLTWGTTGDDTDGNGEQTVKFDTPAEAALNYQTVTDAAACDGVNAPSANRGVGCSADVTSLVQAGGAGTYTVADIEQRANTAGADSVDDWSGWALYIVFSNPSQPLRRIVLSDGFQTVSRNSPSATVALTGFTAPASGTVSAHLDYAVGEGDAGITGDNATLNTTKLDTRSTPDLMNSTIANLDYASSRNPSFLNNYGFDFHNSDITGAIANGDTSANFNFTTSGDTYYPFSTGITIDLAEPNVVLTKTLNDVNGGVVEAGDVIEYQIVAQNQGNDGATNVALTDAIPTHATYLPGSLQVTAGANAGNQTDAAGDDQADYDSGTNAVTFRVGTGATSSAGGVLAANTGTTTVKFRVTLDPNLGDNVQVTNTANGSYVGQTSLSSYANPSTIAATPARRADMVIAQNLGTLTAGQQSTISLIASNTGGATTHGNAVTVTTSVPSEVTFDSIVSASGWICDTSSLPTITCTRSDVLNAGASYPAVTYSGTPSQTAPGATFVASVAGGNEADTTNDSGSSSPTFNRSADLSLTNIADRSSANVGDTITYTVSGHNAGPSTTTGVATTATLPPGLQPLTATLGGSACTISSQTITCATGALGVGGSADTATITITAKVLIAAAGTTVTVDPSIAGNDADPTPANNDAAASVAVNASADLQLTETVAPSSVNPGSNATYTFTVTNQGPQGASGVSLSDDLPSGVTVQSITPSQGTCGTGDPFTCALGTLASAASTTVTVVVTPPLSAAGTSLANSGSVTSSSFDANSANDAATASVAVNDAADLRTTVTATPTSAAAGDTVDYLVTVHNDGPSTATGATVDLDLPNGATIISVTPSSGVTCPATGDPRTCTLGALTSGAAPTIAVKIQLTGANAGSNVTLSANASATTFDPTAGNNADSATVAAGTVADLALTETASPSTVDAGSNATYTFTATNNGPNAAGSVTLSDDLPAGVTVVSITPSQGTCGTGDPFSCNLGTLGNGAAATVTVVLTPNTASAGGPLANPGSVTSGTPDPDPSNNTATASVTVNAAADLTTTVTPAQISAQVGDTIDYLVTVHNGGPQAATSVAVDLNLPNGATIVGVTPSSGSCTAGDPQTCTFAGPLASGADATIAVKITLNGVNAGTAANVAAVASATTYDPTPANNAGSGSVPVDQAADLKLTETVSPASANPGADVTYTFTVTNDGPGAAKGVDLTDDLPAGATLVSVTPPTGITCGTTDPFHCAVGTLAVGASATFTVVLRAPISAAGSAMSNPVSASSTSYDPSPANNASSAATSVNPAADLAAAASVDHTTAVVGDTLNYLLTVTNNGPSTATNAALLVHLPAGAAIVSVTPSSGTCDSSSPRNCSLGAIATGATATVAVKLTVTAANAGNVITVSGDASASEFEPDASNNSATASSNAGDAADLRITKTSDRATANVGDTITWTITATNNGPQPALGTTVTDPIPAGITIISAASTVGTCSVGGTSTSCAPGTLGSGASAVITVKGIVKRSAASTPLGSQASVTGSVFDPDTSNNTSASATTNVGPASDLRLVKLVSNPNPRPGEQVTWTLQILSDGPSAASNVHLTDVVPAGAPIDAVTASAGTCTHSGQTVDCVIPTIASGSSATVTITATVSRAAGGASLNNSATVTSATLDPDTSNNTSAVSSTAGGAADLAVVLTPDRQDVTVGQPITWNGVVMNNGPQTATATIVTLQLPDGLADVTATTPGGTCTVDGRTVTCQLPDIPNGGTQSLTIIGTPTRANADTNLNMSGVVAANETDPAPADNTTVSGVVGVASAVDLRLTKTADKSSATVDEPLTITSTVINNGPSTATDVVVTDVLPDGVELQSVSSSQGTCSVSGQTITCNLGTLADGRSAQIKTVVVVRSAGLGQRLLSGGTVNSAQIDLNPTDNAADWATVTIAPAAAPAAAPFLDFTKTVDKTAPMAGDTVLYTVTARNRGNAAATNVRVVDQLPVGLKYLRTKVTGGTCSRSAATITCVVTSLAPGKALVARIRALVVSPGSIANTATVTATGLPKKPSGSQIATAGIKAGGGGFVVAGVKTLEPYSRPGKSFRVAVKITNVGAGTATGNRVCFRLPSSVVLTHRPPGLSQRGSEFCLGAASLARGKHKRVVLNATVVGPAGSKKPTLKTTSADAHTKSMAFAFVIRGALPMRAAGVTG